MATESLIIELDAKTKKLDAALKDTNVRLDKLDGSVKKADQSFVKFGKSAAIAAGIAATAISALSIEAANFAKEIQVAATRAGETVEAMQALAFASSTVGISLEKLGDISKDTKEKIGEFLVTGGGGFVDFIDVLQLSRTEALRAAQAFEKMSGPDVLQEMVRQMEEAGVSGSRMSFALEGIASDTTDLIPLLTNGAEKLNALKNEFDGLGTTLSQEQLERIREVGIELSKFGNIFSAEGRALVSEYSDEIITVINAFEALGLKVSDVLSVVTSGLIGSISVAKAAISDLINGTETLDEVLDRSANRSRAAQEALFQGRKAQSKATEGGIIEGKREAKEQGLSLNQRASNLKSFSSIASSVNSAFLEDNKAIKAGIIVADAASAVMLQLSSGDPFTAFPRAAAAAAIGVAQLANALSASKGGGSVNAGGGDAGGGGGGFTPSAPEIETSSLSVTEQSAEGGIQTTRIEFATDSGDSILDAIAEGLNERQRQGG